MKKIVACIGYALVAASVIMIDRITKLYALAHFIRPVSYNAYISAEVVINRGISWGMFSGKQFFLGISLLVVLITIAVLIYAVRRWSSGHAIIGETLVIAGAFSNLVDRFVYGGVIDFIALSYDAWSFPVFNVADSAIVLGVIILFMCDSA